MSEIIEQDGVKLDVEQYFEWQMVSDAEIAETYVKLHKLCLQRAAHDALVAVLAPHHAKRITSPPVQWCRHGGYSPTRR